jgi:acyl carrier protein
MTLSEQIRTFIIENFLFGDASVQFDDDASLIEADLVDSTGILELVSHVEVTYGFPVQDSEIVPGNFDSINRIAAFVSSHTGKSKVA